MVEGLPSLHNALGSIFKRKGKKNIAKKPFATSQMHRDVPSFISTKHLESSRVKQ